MIQAGTFTVQADHPALAGHFPGNPVVPGVVLLDHVASAILAAHLGHRLAAVPQVKFLRPVRPGERVTIAYQPGPSPIRFTCSVGADEAIRGTLHLDPLP